MISQAKLQRLPFLRVKEAMQPWRPFHIVFEAEALAAAYRLRIYGYEHTLMRVGYHTEIFKQIESNCMFSMDIT